MAGWSWLAALRPANSSRDKITASDESAKAEVNSSFFLKAHLLTVHAVVDVEAADRIYPPAGRVHLQKSGGHFRE
jgi:hypothetical protein